VCAAAVIDAVGAGGSSWRAAVGTVRPEAKMYNRYLMICDLQAMFLSVSMLLLC